MTDPVHTLHIVNDKLILAEHAISSLPLCIYRPIIAYINLFFKRQSFSFSQKFTDKPGIIATYGEYLFCNNSLGCIEPMFLVRVYLQPHVASKPIVCQIECSIFMYIQGNSTVARLYSDLK